MVYHRLNRDTLPKVRGLYLVRVLDVARAEVDRLERRVNQARLEGRTKEASRLHRQLDEARSALQELEALDEALESLTRPSPRARQPKPGASWLEQKIAEVRENGYNPVIDYGVLVNITPLKEAGVLHPDAARVK